MAEQKVFVENIVATTLSGQPITTTSTVAGQPLSIYETKNPLITAAYGHSREDLAGVAGSYNYTVLYNPIGSDKLVLPISTTISFYITTGGVTSKSAMHLRRITGAPTGGVIAPASEIFKYDTNYANAAAVVYTTNPTVTYGASLVSIPPAVNPNGAAVILEHLSSSPTIGPIVLRPGEGVVSMITNGDTDLIINSSTSWGEM